VADPVAIVVMGVAGCGKSTIASLLAARLGWRFIEADAFHSASNVAKMSAGTPLTDEDRWPWLAAIAAHIADARATGRPCVVACSALRRIYRDRLSGRMRDVRFVYLRGSFETIAARLATRSGHYMPPSLLQSQFATLEEPTAEENALTLLAERPVEALVEDIIQARGPATPS
jgi:carbohydrate kinase (thermoresistant glucokinase family)